MPASWLPAAGIFFSHPCEPGASIPIFELQFNYLNVPGSWMENEALNQMLPSFYSW